MKDRPSGQPAPAGRGTLYAGFSLLYGPLAPAYEGLMQALHAGQWFAWQREVWGDAVGERPAPLRVLEVGCGTGRFLAHLAAQGHDAVGLDISPRMARRARRRGGVVVNASVTATPFQGGAFDVVVGMFFPLAALHDGAAWEEVARVLRPGGTFLYLHWARMAGRVYPLLRRAAYGSRYDRPLGELPAIASRYLTVEAKTLVDDHGHELHYLLGRKSL
jgi:SAM-dependent methyltransferase